MDPSCWPESILSVSFLRKPVCILHVAKKVSCKHKAFKRVYSKIYTCCFLGCGDTILLVGYLVYLNAHSLLVIGQLY